MITITYNHLNSTAIEPALARLAQTTLPAKTAYNLGKITQEVGKELRTAKGNYAQLMLAYCEQETDGKFKFDENKMPVVKKEDQETFMKEMKEMMASSFTVNRNKITFSELSGAELTPAEMVALEPILELEA